MKKIGDDDDDSVFIQTIKVPTVRFQLAMNKDFDFFIIISFS
jgi:hypothetical protein